MMLTSMGGGGHQYISVCSYFLINLIPSNMCSQQCSKDACCILCHLAIITRYNKSSPRDCKVWQAAYPMYISCTFKMSMSHCQWGFRTLTPGDLGNYRSQTKMPIQKLFILFSLHFDTSPDSLRLFVSEIWPNVKSVCGSVHNPDLALHTTVFIRLFWKSTYMLDVGSSLCKIIFRILCQRSRS